MSGTADWSPDKPLDTERYDAWDEELDEEDEVAPNAIGHAEGERSLDRQLILDDAAVEQADAELDDPERLAVLDGGIDDPDGAGPFEGRARPEEEGWDLDAAERLARRELDDNE